MRRLLLSSPICLALIAGNPKPKDVPLIDLFHEQVQLRFDAPFPNELGMSRMAVPNSMGQHFQPVRTALRDFVPANAEERELLEKLEENRIQLGMYLVGRAILTSAPELPSIRALKGPAAITRETVRPAWYPGPEKPAEATADQKTATADQKTASADALPDWNAIYPLAKRAMRSFDDGGAGFETKLAGWDIAARPVQSEARCEQCHRGAKLPDTSGPRRLGGVLYAFRRTQHDAGGSR